MPNTAFPWLAFPNQKRPFRHERMHAARAAKRNATPTARHADRAASPPHSGQALTDGRMA
jgi:hypothetical protein